MRELSYPELRPGLAKACQCDLGADSVSPGTPHRDEHGWVLTGKPLCSLGARPSVFDGLRHSLLGDSWGIRNPSPVTPTTCPPSANWVCGENCPPRPEDPCLIFHPSGSQNLPGAKTDMGL